MNDHSPLLELTMTLMACPSITPDDAGCQKILSRHLTHLGFSCEQLNFGKVSNLWARLGNEGPLFVFAGHTDVVPTGPLSEWTFPPFDPQITEGILFGRGASDMKSGIAAMVSAVERFVNDYPRFIGSIAFLITSDEEAEAIDGTQKVLPILKERGIKIDYCLLGEPSSMNAVGDQIRVGRRGSLHGQLIIEGKQGHVAHPLLARNPIHLALAALAELAAKTWDEGNASFPPTTFQITNIHAGTGAANIIPGHLDVTFNFRFGTASTIADLQAQTEAILQQHNLVYHIKWDVGGNPFLTPHGKLISATQNAIKTVTGLDTHLSTGGGTSDGRFIAPTGAEIVELGVSHATAHQIDEQVATKDVETLSAIYYQLLQGIFACTLSMSSE